jgi:hypothetical protein
MKEEISHAKHRFVSIPGAQLPGEGDGKNSPPSLLTNNLFPGTLAVTGTDNIPDNDFVTVFKISSSILTGLIPDERAARVPTQTARMRGI